MGGGRDVPWVAALRSCWGRQGYGPGMAPIVLDPDEVNQDRHVTLTDGRTLDLGKADAALLHRIARQLQVHRSSYLHAYQPADQDLADQVAVGEVALEEVAPLYVRVTALQRAIKGTGGRGAEQVDVAALLQATSWTSSAGATLPLVEMTPTHRRNLQGWLERHSLALEKRFEEATLTDAQRHRVEPADPWVAGTPLYRRLTALIAAESTRERAMDQARQVVRHVEFDRSGRWPDR